MNEDGVMTHGRNTIVVARATGQQPSAAARQVLEDGWYVRGLTRNPVSDETSAPGRLMSAFTHVTSEVRS